MGWQRKQYDKSKGKFKKVKSIKKDWLEKKDEKQDERRKAG